MPETRLDTARIRAARRVIDPIFLDTPLYRCEALEPGLGCTVSIKLETANPVRSFKARGTEVVASLLAGNGSRAVVCASAGNLGQALAWSGRGRGLDVTVVASRFAPAAKLDRIRALDARLELVDGDFDMARERAAAVARYDGIRLVEDSLDIETCEGAATIGLELADTVPAFNAVLIALGGGALATGVGHVLKPRAPEVEVICIQPLGAPAMTHSWRQRRVVTTGPASTIADGIAGRRPIRAVLDDLLLVADNAVLVQEASIIAGMRMLLDHAGLVVEPSAALGIATGCSSIYGGNLPTTPYCVDKAGRGPTWCNSLFEDNAEFGLGFRVSIDKQKEFAVELVKKLAPQLGDDLVNGIVNAVQTDEAGIYEQRERVAALKQKLAKLDAPEAKLLLPVADTLVKRSVWIFGGDGWAYDIGYGGLDHVLASGRDVNVLVMDTEVYSNTGGQMSKSTPRGAVAKFAAGGKPAGKKDLGLIAMSYGNIYVASVAMGEKDEQTLRAFVEAESYPGPSLIIAYSHCIAHGIAVDMGVGARQQKLAVESGQWLLYRYDPRRTEAGENPLQLDSAAAKSKVQDYLLSENRFKMLTKSKPEDAKKFFAQAQVDADRRWKFYQYMSGRNLKSEGAPAPAQTVRHGGPTALTKK